MPDLSKLERKIIRGASVTDTVEKFDWKEFEEIVGDIFRRNDFTVRNNFRFKTDRRWENDLLAIRGSLAFCVDCKRWSDGREKRHGLTKAANEQRDRTRALEKFFKTNPIARNMVGPPDAPFVPMIATLHQENITRENDTFVVPIEKLNTFILSYESIT